MTGLTDRQAILLELSGMLELVSWKVQTARTAYAEDKDVAEYLRKVGVGLENLRKWSTQHGWRDAVAVNETQRGGER